ncbi:hypothetical protein R75465_02216 [Paraburkholderia aspalathi]|uniref:DUF1376 domain-containing protein n=1 Tax=Paraburkholderia aspalathi TaxID=1324617 RepID=UPI001B1A3007|nr:DUF1376 domain-containing protein [Paraburkholderia aspalathi]CAE6739812.1 hypothetical protein R75465_02216 [Paraburkholderia aspalathi]
MKDDNGLPEPMMPADCDLREYPFLQLEIQRVLRSKAWLKAKRKPELGFYMVNLWMAAWHEVPAGSLEDDNDVLADLAMCHPDRWLELRDDVLHGWIKCSDGRWYNPTVCEKAMPAWETKTERLKKEGNERDRQRRHRAMRSEMFDALRDLEIVPPWDIKMDELRELHTKHVTGGSAPVTH